MQPVKPRTAKYFQLVPGRYPAAEDLADIKDRVIRNRLLMRLQKAEMGNFGIHRRFGDFLELISDFGPGFRIYLGEDGPVLIIILVVGDKSTQVADFKEARAYWDAYQSQKRKGKSHDA